MDFQSPRLQPPRAMALHGTQPHTATRIAEGPLREGQEDGDVRDIQQASWGWGRIQADQHVASREIYPLCRIPVCYWGHFKHHIMTRQ